MRIILTLIATILIANLTVLGGTDFDIDGDGKADPAVYRWEQQQWWYTNSANNTTGVDTFGGAQGATPLVGDYTGDGKTDFAYTNLSANGLTWNILRSDGTGFYSFPFGISDDQPVAGDFDGDGIADPTVIRGPHFIWFTLLSTTGEVRVNQFGTQGDFPLVKDYDGDGISDIAIYRFSTSEWWINQSRDGLVVYKFGATSQAFYGFSPADIDGDGAAELVYLMFDQATQKLEWFVSPSGDRSTFYSFEYGLIGDIPVTADYDGDGNADIGIYRPNDGTWYINQSRDGLSILNFGAGEDLPIQAIGIFAV